jgi:hypothetical protein
MCAICLSHPIYLALIFVTIQDQSTNLEQQKHPLFSLYTRMRLGVSNSLDFKQWLSSTT